MIWTLAFWKGAAERAIKTLLQVFVAVIGVTGIGTTVGVTEVNWLGALSIALVSAVLSLATSIANADFVAGIQKPLHSANYVNSDHETPRGGVRLDGL